MADFELGHVWNHSMSQLMGGGRRGAPIPWSNEFAKAVFNGDRRITPNLIHMTVLARSEDGIAIAEFQDAGRTVVVEFLNADGFPKLRYLFVDASKAPHLCADGYVRPGQLFLTSIMSFEYRSELDQHGGPIKSRQLQSRIMTTSTRREVTVEIEDAERPYTGSMVLDIDVSGDGFWEPVATFGDWERWFVRDRPGVELFD